MGEGPQALILGQIEHAFLDDSVARQTDKGIEVSAEAVNPLVRLGGNDYTTLGKPFTIARP